MAVAPLTSARSKASRAPFKFKKIAEYIEGGLPYDPTIYSGESFVDEELSDIDTSAPAAPATVGEPGPWVQAPTVSRLTSTLGEDGVRFTVCRWTRTATERIEYWVATGRSHPDFFYVFRRADWYLIVGCITGHPFVRTPSVSWENGDGSTEPVPFVYTTVDELIQAAAAAGKDYVKNQVH